MRRFTATATAILVCFAALPAIMPQAAALGTYTITNGEILTSNITADTIVLPATAIAYWAGDITLNATTKIDIRGELYDYSDGVPKDINLISSKDIVVAGWVIGARGQDRANETSNTSITGQAGGNGASVYVQWGMLGQFTLAAGARLEAGRGGGGANVSVVAGAGSPANITATGGAGGRGGNVTLNGVIGANYGTIIHGPGGHGGYVNLTDSPGYETKPWSNLSAIGGTPGAGGSIQGSWVSTCLPNCGTVNMGSPSLSIDQEGLLVNRVLRSEPGAPGENCGTAYARGKDAETMGYPGQNAEAHNDGCIPGDGGGGCPGGRGGEGGSAEAYGGHGAPSAVSGGHGGWAKAYAGDGGNGGPAAELTCFGGNGGRGGDAVAVGGDGGNGCCFAGHGGTATAVSGDGGYGTDGGLDGLSGTATATPGRDGAAWGS